MKYFESHSKFPTEIRSDVENRLSRREEALDVPGRFAVIHVLFCRAGWPYKAQKGPRHLLMLVFSQRLTINPRVSCSEFFAGILRNVRTIIHCKLWLSQFVLYFCGKFMAKLQYILPNNSLVSSRRVTVIKYLFVIFEILSWQLDLKILDRILSESVEVVSEINCWAQMWRSEKQTWI